MKKIIKTIVLLSLVVLIGVMGANIVSLQNQINDLKQSNKSNVVSNNNVVKVSQVIENDVSEVYQKVSHSVVTILNEVNGIQVGTGSGVIYKVDGETKYIVTNQHVIDGASMLKVVLSSGEELEATLIGSDSYYDLAVLTVKTDKELMAMTMGDSSQVKVGETVLAIGSPQGQNFAGSLSVGVISGKDRVIEVDVNQDNRSDWDMVLLQTDAAINPGNSGGALVNMAGQLIGINNMKLVDRTIEGIGFSIPVNEVMNVVSQLEKDGEVKRPQFGIRGRDVQELQAYSHFYNLQLPDVETGVYVTDVLNDSSAQQSGIEVGDIILKFNESDVNNFKELRQQLYAHKQGDVIKVTLLREGKEVVVSVTLK